MRAPAWAALICGVIVGACGGDAFEAGAEGGDGGSSGGTTDKGGSSSGKGGKSATGGSSGSSGSNAGGTSGATNAGGQAGVTPSGGTGARGGVAGSAGDDPGLAGAPGAGGASNDGPLELTDLLTLSAANLPGFNDLGFRCKSLSICGVEQSCIYSDAASHLGSVQSGEAQFYDGTVLIEPQPIKLRIRIGAQSQCSDPDVALSAGESIDLGYDGGQLTVYFPAFIGKELTLFIAADGATYYDASLTELAQAPL